MESILCVTRSLVVGRTRLLDPPGQRSSDRVVDRVLIIPPLNVNAKDDKQSQVLNLADLHCIRNGVQIILFGSEGEGMPNSYQPQELSVDSVASSKRPRHS